MNWFQLLLRRRQLYGDLREEIQQHLEERTARFVAEGMDPTDAQQKAKREFGNVTLIEERSREVWLWATVESIWADVRYAFRQIRARFGFSSLCIVTVALGIGANTALFSVLRAVVLNPLPYPNAPELIDLQSADSRTGQASAVSYPDFFDWRAQNHTLAHVISYRPGSYTLTGKGNALNLDAEVVSWDLLAALGVVPEIGRGFTQEDEKAGTRVVLISDRLWASQFDKDTSILGRGIRLSGELFTIIGVLPSAFEFPFAASQNDVWTTLAVDTDAGGPPASRDFNFLGAMGAMKPGVTLPQASADLNSIATNLAKRYPDSNAHHDAVRVETLLASTLGDTRRTLFIIQSAVALVLLMVCVNIAGLLLSRVRDRHREIAMRTTLGAGRVRIVRQLLIESSLLGGIGGAAGCCIALVCTPAIVSLVRTDIPRAASAVIDFRVLTFATLLSFASALMFGIVPAITASRMQPVPSLKAATQSGPNRRQWVYSLLIVCQVALGLMLTSGATLLTASFVHLQRADHGFRTDHLLTLLFVLPESRYSNSRDRFYREYFEKVRSIPGVEAAGGTINLPIEGMMPFEVHGNPIPEAERRAARFSTISTGYFHTMQVPFVHGRDFTDGDDVTREPVMIVSKSFARKYLPGLDPISQKLRLAGMPDGQVWRQIVGVVGDVRLQATQLDAEPTIYIPAAQSTHSCCLYTVVRTRIDPLAVEHSIQSVLTAMDKEIPIVQVNTMDQLISDQLWQPRVVMILLASFATLALLLTIVGTHGVMAYSVSRQTHDIGVRMALGARRTLLLRRVLREAAALLGAGVIVGFAGTIAASSLLTNIVYGVASSDLRVFAFAVALVIACGLIASLLPALRATTIRPVEALRHE